jgi:hypothetical protein
MPAARSVRSGPVRRLGAGADDNVMLRPRGSNVKDFVTPVTKS